MLQSSVCTQAQLESPDFRQWAARMNEGFRLHRKLWEFCFIAQALSERGKLQPGMRGLGFAVGKEPLSALFASMGCTIVATDLDPATAGVTTSEDWAATNQHASSLDALNVHGLCTPQLLAERVSFRYADMNKVPADLRGFDFLWSSCAVEHVGSLDLSKTAVRSMMNCLKPGGIAVHTTEFNVHSNTDTLETGGAVIYRQRDLEELAQMLSRDGHAVTPFDLRSGAEAADHFVDEPPYESPIHLKLKLGPYVATSVGLIVEAKGQPRRTWWKPWAGRRKTSTLNRKHLSSTGKPSETRACLHSRPLASIANASIGAKD